MTVRPAHATYMMMSLMVAPIASRTINGTFNSSHFMVGPGIQDSLQHMQTSEIIIAISNATLPGLHFKKAIPLYYAATW
jgi:hypothetical protein